MMNKTLLLCFLFVLVIGAKAQVSLAVQVPPTGILQKSQLWNVTIVSTSTKPIPVYLQLTLLSLKDNAPLMTATTGQFTLSTGAKQINSREVEPIQYNYLSAAFNADRNPNGMLPIGNYMLCYAVMSGVGEYTVQLAEECVPLEVEPLSPPLLNTPLDGDTIATAYPQFTWLPPAPLALFTDLSYDIIIAELQPGQSPLEAIQYNIPLYSAGNIRNLASAYPASSKALDTARWYVWNIIARNGDQLVAKSETWSFRTACPEKTALPLFGNNYIVLKRENEAGGVTHITGDTLGLRLYARDVKSDVVIRISQAGQTIAELKKELTYGDNYLRFPLNKRFEKKKVYLVEMNDPKSVRYTASFIIN